MVMYLNVLNYQLGELYPGAVLQLNQGVQMNPLTSKKKKKKLYM